MVVKVMMTLLMMLLNDKNDFCGGYEDEGGDDGNSNIDDFGR